VILLRITGGHIRGRRLASLKGLNIRPSSDKIRETIFNLIGQDMTGLRILDLFAGTGSLGLEALSRGASEALFIDYLPQSIKLIKKNLILCGYEDSGIILKKDLTRGLPWSVSPERKKMNLVFLDPPYGKELIMPLLRELGSREILSSPSIVVTESSKSDETPRLSGKFQMEMSKIYGETKLDVFHYD